MSGNDCEMKIEFNARELMEKVATEIEIEFLTEKSKPKNYMEAIQAARHILKSLSESFRDMADETRVLIAFAKALKLDKDIDVDSELKRATDSMDVPDFVKTFLKDLLAHSKMKDSKHDRQ